MDVAQEEKQVSVINDTGIPFKISGGIARRISLHNTAAAIERDVGLDLIYTLIADGETDQEIAATLGISEKDFSYIVKRNDDLRRRYMNARTYSLSTSSLETLGEEDFKNARELDQDQGRAADHHRKLVDSTSKILNGSKDDNAGSGITVNNTIVVKSKSDIPDLPDELKGIIDVTPQNKELTDE